MVRYLEQAEKQNIRPLYQTCFDDTEEYCNYYFEKRMPQNEVAVCEVLVSEWEVEQEISPKQMIYKGMIHLIPKTVAISGKFMMQCHYLYAVATAPEFRKQGVMGKILKKVMYDLYAHGEFFTYLIPSSEENAQIYRKYGFARVMDKPMLKTKEFRKDIFPEVKIRCAQKEDIVALSEFAQQKMAERYTIYISKNCKYFETMQELMAVEGGEITIYESDGKIFGYRIGSEDEVIEEVLDASISELAWESSECTPYTMARILNISGMLKHAIVKNSGYIYIEVIDLVIEENNGVFLWEYGDCGCRWTKAENQKPEVTVTIEELMAHLTGYKKIARLPEMNVKQGFYINDYV